MKIAAIKSHTYKKTVKTIKYDFLNPFINRLKKKMFAGKRSSSTGVKAKILKCDVFYIILCWSLYILFYSLNEKFN